MNNFKKFIKSPIVGICAFLVAAGLLLFASIGGARSALQYFSETYATRITMYDIGVSLNENGSKVSWRDYQNEWSADEISEDGKATANGSWATTSTDKLYDKNVAITGKLLTNLLPEGEELKIGKAYDEKISVTNSGTINHYLRVTLTKYWADENDNKLVELDPATIDLHLTLGDDWILDESSSTDERIVLYYNKLLLSGQTTSPCTDTLTINEFVAKKVTQEVKQEGEFTTITTTYDYDGKKFMIEASVDAVQEHNAEKAIYSAWGRKVTIKNNTLSLAD